MKTLLPFFTVLFLFTPFHKYEASGEWIRINQLGYSPDGVKVAVWCSKSNQTIKTFQLVDATTNKPVFSSTAGRPFGAYGPFTQTHRLNFTPFKKPGRYYLQAGNARSPEFIIGTDVYKGSADFCLRYMRQQRTGFNPFLKDSCHTHDGYVLYGEKAGIKDSTHIDVVGGWHDATDYLQYSSTSANATYHLLAAYRDFKNVFADEKQANGLDGKNGMVDVLDEAKWGLDWLSKMHPRAEWMFNQIADDRDHMGMRIPKEDSFYGRGYERPVYFISGEPQQRGKFMNNTTGTSSTAAKFCSAFLLGSDAFKNLDSKYTEMLEFKAFFALAYSLKKPGYTQTASVRSPYIYAEENWVDDMELAFAVAQNLFNEEAEEPEFGKKVELIDIDHPNRKIKRDSAFEDSAFLYASREPVTPWLGKDTANHYQWYPFINLGHYELAKQLKGKRRNTVIGYYKQGIQLVWNKAKQNAFYRGVPFIWCSNNLTTSFAIQCYWYRQLTADKTFSELEQANFDWLFGCNPWGTSMVYGLPSWGDTPVDPHSSFTHLKKYPIDGGLVDGPVYGSIYKNLIGITLYNPDGYAEFQSNLAVYHDDYGDFSTNEPTMDGTASLVYLLAARDAETRDIVSYNKKFSYNEGAITRGDSSKREIALVFTGDEFADGGNVIARTLSQQNVKASFFFTGRFYNNNAFKKIVQQLKTGGHYLGPHSNEHLLYCDWANRDSLLVTKEAFTNDLRANLDVIQRQGIDPRKVKYFLPPYEWYNDSIARWTNDLGLQLINYTPGTLSHADYTTPFDKNYRATTDIYQSIIDYDRSHLFGLNGFILLMHIGTDPRRTDKLYNKLPELIRYLLKQRYSFKKVNELLDK